ncbi:unnamed protein product, partial [Onchocerca ochengi]
LQSVGCKLPDEVENGEIIYPVITRMKNQIGSIAFLLCNPPFVLEGNAIAACCSDGEWRPSLGICKNATYCLPYVYKDAVSLHYDSVSLSFSFIDRYLHLFSMITRIAHNMERSEIPDVPFTNLSLLLYVDTKRDAT